MVATIMIVDDHPVTREGLSVRIDVEHDLLVCGEASDVDEALKLAAEVNPDLAVIDVSLKTGNGIELIKSLKAQDSHVRVLVWSMYDESLYAERALRAGAMGYVNKEHASEQIIDAVRQILKGEICVSPEMLKRIMNRVVCGKDIIGESPTTALSNREFETFTLIGHGKTTAEIARMMNLSPKTIETYRARIKNKLEIDDMASLVREATQWVLENA